MPAHYNPNDWESPSAWRSEVDRSRSTAEPHWPAWEENLQYYKGQSPDAAIANSEGSDWVTVPADHTNISVKLPQLFFDTPKLQLSAVGEFKPATPMPGAPPVPDGTPIVGAHRALLNELLGPDQADVLSVVKKAVKDCLLTAGVGATKIHYQASMESIPTPPEIGAVLGLRDETIDRPVDEQWLWERIPSKKFRIPSDFHDTDFDRAPWLGMEFRVPLALAKRLFNVPDDYTGTQDRDTKILNDVETRATDVGNIPYVDGVEIWYQAAIFDADVINPLVIRRHILLEGLDQFVEKDRTNPYQELGPNGRLTADSMRGYPIHVLCLDSIPDSAYVPSEASVVRPLVRELCRFRTQQVQERDANIPRVVFDSAKVTPESLQKIKDGTIGALIPLEEGALAGGIETIMAQVIQGNQTRGSYIANDYIQRDLDRALGLDAVGGDDKGPAESATEIAVVDRQRNVRLDEQRKAVLSWYLKGVAKFSALVCRYMTPQLAVPYIGQRDAAIWAQWDKKAWDGRFVFDAQADSQLKLDAAAERKFALDLYQFTAKDPNVNRIPLLKNLFIKAGMDPNELIVPQLPEKHKDLSASLAIKGEDLVAPQQQIIIELLAQLGFEISQQALNQAGNQMMQSIALGIRDADGKAVKATPAGPAEHGGTAEQVRPLSKQKGDQTGDRSGPKSGVQ